MKFNKTTQLIPTKPGVYYHQYEGFKPVAVHVYRFNKKLEMLWFNVYKNSRYLEILGSPQFVESTVGRWVKTNYFFFQSSYYGT